MPGETELDIYLDACIVIYLVECHPRLATPIQEALLRQTGARVAWTHLTRLESRTKPLRDNNRQTLQLFDTFFSAPTARRVELTPAIFDLATELRATHGLKTPDALHLAAAILGGCKEFWTNDSRLEKAAAGRIAIVTFN